MNTRNAELYSSIATKLVHYFDFNRGECEMNQHSFILTGWMYQDMGE